MAKPIISKFSVIDATRENIVRYTCYDDTINEVKYIIYDNASGNIIVNQTVKTSGSSSVRMFMLPANLIHNRLLPYYLKIAVTNQNGNTSDLSDAVLFYCHEKPVLTFVDVEARAEKTIPFPAFSFNVEYKNIEEEGETLNLYKYQLYDSDKTLLHEEIYHGSISHAFNVESLDNNKVYYVRAVGETVNGYVLDTDFCAFRIEYDGQLQKLEIVAENEKREGRIKLTITKNEDEPNNFDSIRVKRREVGKYDWITIYEKKITSSVEPILIVWNDVVTLLKDNKLNMSYNMNPNDTGASILLLKLKQASIQDGTRFSFICPEDIAINARICVENLVTTIKTNPTGAGQYRETTRAVYGPMMLFKAVTNEKGEDEPEDTSLLRKGRYYVIKYGEHWLNQATDGAFTYKFNALTGKYEKEQRDPQVRYYPKQIYNPSTKNYDTVYVKYNPTTNTEIQISDPALLIESRVYFIGQSQSHAMTKFVDPE